MKKGRAKGLLKPRKSRVSAVFQVVFIMAFIAGLGGMLLTARALGIFFKS
ncbi:MAG TPA: hypothetical protein VJC08_00665 [bacterium]|nr:hypothetical protein [bacterium]